MSLLDRGNEMVVLYLEETITDPDGNPISRPSQIGIAARATIQPLGSSGDDSSAEGFVGGMSRYRMRLSRSFPYTLGAQSRVEWRGLSWSLIGDPVVFGGSRKTAHVDYTIGRA
jgi:hypothetical protein